MKSVTVGRDVGISMLDLRQCKYIQKLVLLMAVLVRVKEFIMPAGSANNGNRRVFLSVPALSVHTAAKTSRYCRTARDFPRRERVSRINPATCPFLWSPFPE
jgi:hypothetical protein